MNDSFHVIYASNRTDAYHVIWFLISSIFYHHHAVHQVLLLMYIYIYSKAVFVFPGQSTITFIYDFVESFGGPHPGYAVVSGRPQAGKQHSIKQCSQHKHTLYRYTIIHRVYDFNIITVYTK